MKSYILSITITSIIGAFIYIAAPSRMQKYISVLISIILIGIIISPINKKLTLDYIQDSNTEDRITDEDTNKLAAESLSKSIAQTLKNDFDLKALAVDVDIKENSSFVVNRVIVYISNAVGDKSIIESKLRYLYNCEIYITTQ